MRASPARSACTKRSTTHRRACPPDGIMRWCVRTWPTIRAWACWRCCTCCASSRCSSASSPMPSSGPPCCCCRSASRAPACSIRTRAKLTAHARSAPPARPHCGSSPIRRRRGLPCRCCPMAATTRWREDGTRDCWGSFCYLRDVDSGEFWSTALQPTGVPVERYEAIFCDAKAEYRGRHRGYDMHLEIAVSAEDDIELRRLRLSNRASRPRTIEITTYAEVVLAPALSADAHPAFSNLFVQTQIVRDKQALLCTRRPRSRQETPPWILHLVAVHGADIEAISYETDRARFLGRGNTTRAPQALTEQEALSDSAGSVLDPIVAIRTRITLAGDQQAVIDMVTGIDPQREGCIALIDKYRDRHLADRVFDLAWTHSEAVRRQINASQADAYLFERLAGPLVYAHPFLRAAPQVLLQNRRGQAGLWGQAISGDLPIVLLQVAELGSLELVRQLVRAHAYWRLKGLEIDLVIWNEEQGGYRQELQEQILDAVGASPEAHLLDQRGGVFVRAAHSIAQEDRILIQSVAREIGRAHV